MNNETVKIYQLFDEMFPDIPADISVKFCDKIHNWYIDQEKKIKQKIVNDFVKDVVPLFGHYIIPLSKELYETIKQNRRENK